MKRVNILKLLAKASTAVLLLKVVSVFVKWYRNVLFLRGEAEKHPTVVLCEEYSSNPLSMALSVVRNANTFHDFRVLLYKKYSSASGRKVDTLLGCGIVQGFAPLVFTTNRDIVKYVLKDNLNTYIQADTGARYFMEKSFAASDQGPFAKDGGKFYSYQRKAASKIFTQRSINVHAKKCMLHHTEKILGRIESHGRVGIPMKDYVEDFTFAAISELGFGYRYEEGEQQEYQEAFDQIFLLLAQGMVNPFWSLPLSRHFVAGRKGLYNSVEKLRVLCRKIIENRRSSGKMESFDFLSLFMSGNAPPEYSSDEYLLDLVMLMLAGGRDTSARVLQFTLYHIASDEKLQQKIYQSVEASDGSHETNHFLRCVIHESLRLYSPVAMALRKAARDDVLPNGLKIKKGTVVSYDTYAMARNPDVFPEPNKFKPERWMKSGRDNPDFDEYGLPFFSGGPRICIGKDLAMLEMCLFLGNLLTKYKVSLSASEKAALQTSDVLYGNSLLLGYKHKLVLDFEPRVA